MNIKVTYALSYETPENSETHEFLRAFFFNIFSCFLWSFHPRSKCRLWEKLTYALHMKRTKKCKTPSFFLGLYFLFVYLFVVISPLAKISRLGFNLLMSHFRIPTGERAEHQFFVTRYIRQYFVVLKGIPNLASKINLNIFFFLNE